MENIGFDPLSQSRVELCALLALSLPSVPLDPKSSGGGSFVGLTHKSQCCLDYLLCTIGEAGRAGHRYLFRLFFLSSFLSFFFLLEYNCIQFRSVQSLSRV